MSCGQKHGLCCHPQPCPGRRFEERLLPFDYVSEQREDTGRGCAGTAVSPPNTVCRVDDLHRLASPCAFSQGHGHPRSAALQGAASEGPGTTGWETGGGPCSPLLGGRCVGGSGWEKQGQNGVAGGWAAGTEGQSRRFSKAAELPVPLREPGLWRRRRTPGAEGEGQGLLSVWGPGGALPVTGAQSCRL